LTAGGTSCTFCDMQAIGETSDMNLTAEDMAIWERLGAWSVGRYTSPQMVALRAPGRRKRCVGHVARELARSEAHPERADYMAFLRAAASADAILRKKDRHREVLAYGV